jgi:ElaB/YqjD/DUF883 family membrane-anchored ribosome-binding protein
LWNDWKVTRPLAAVPDLEQELDGLYALPLEEFTKARNDLAARLKQAHQNEAADLVRALKKPSVVAAAANRLAREEPHQVVGLLAAGERLREAQQRALAGDGKAEEVNEAVAAERDALRALLASARAQLGERSSATLLDRLGQTLRAAAVDDEGRALLERGRLTEELKAVGFGPLEAVKPARRRSSDEVARAARERVAALRTEARTLSSEARVAEDAAEQAQRAAELLAEEAEQKRADAERVAAELADAEAALRSRR